MYGCFVYTSHMHGLWRPEEGRKIPWSCEPPKGAITGIHIQPLDIVAFWPFSLLLSPEFRIYEY